MKCHSQQQEPGHDNVYGLTNKCVGDYKQIVNHLKDYLTRLTPHQGHYKIVSVGRGGRDTWLTWAIIEAAQAQDTLQRLGWRGQVELTQCVTAH